jgi:hypothetical protein
VVIGVADDVARRVGLPVFAQPRDHAADQQDDQEGSR